MKIIIIGATGFIGKALGGDLLVLSLGPDAGWKWLLDLIAKDNSSQPATITYNRDYEPFARNRDERIEKILVDMGIKLISTRDHLLIEPSEIPPPTANRFYQVYSHYSRAWLNLFKTEAIQKRVLEQREAILFLERSEQKPIFSIKWADLIGQKLRLESDALDRFEEENSVRISIPLPDPGARAALAAVDTFSLKIDRYKIDRDFPILAATSGLSVYFKNGSLTPAMAIWRLKLGQIDNEINENRIHFLKEIIWREFYYSILFHETRVESESFLPQYRDIQWENKQEYFEAWKAGLTGYPIVDAGMRELNETGLMHNRTRMIVASFLTKDLLIDWKWGEHYFMEKLLDGDLACNNGGWQWAASTGCDPQPYLRIFNPILQSKKFDPGGIYIKKYIPELRHFSAEKIHAPWEYGGAKGYPSPIVDHAIQRGKAIKLYQLIDRGTT